MPLLEPALCTVRLGDGKMDGATGRYEKPPESDSRSGNYLTGMGVRIQPRRTQWIAGGSADPLAGGRVENVQVLPPQ